MSIEAGDPRSYAIIGAAMETHRVLGTGFLESVYQQALAIQFDPCKIPFQREAALPVRYKGRDIASFRADFICYACIIVELKAASRLIEIDEAQLIHYLRATQNEIGL